MGPLSLIWRGPFTLLENFPSVWKIVPENTQKIVKNLQKTYFSSKMFQTSQECIMDILDEILTSKISNNVKWTPSNRRKGSHGVHAGFSKAAGLISSFRPISATLSKFEFLAKIDFLAIFGDFRLLKIWLAIWPKVSGNMIGGQKLSLWTSKTLQHNLYAILNTIEKSWFL